MAIPTSAGLRPGLLGGLSSAGVPLALMTAIVVPFAAPARAQGQTPNQPLAIEARPGLSPPPCRLVVPRSEAVLQPLRIHPSQVAQKNGMGCLSAADALYGPDGCPTQLCGQQRGFQVPMPDLGGP
ncbi:hypothetical protein L107_12531 [Cyanobium sp. Copco_Reservoir_LC18]|jgi:hypothetical protein|uniref:hypothetical protein n=1 Tax=Cyanobium sp. Copco_Reservoir_LC18 TaxID=1328305 RepID=UPI0013583085|nr:hypothetical protein [Cyanobium sp. Copco_Reservoir_LC18]KAF0652493.1 hypothetical protein L107_12531 [Cyanobium sp. Copco_Reservoir_LC18]